MSNGQHTSFCCDMIAIPPPSRKQHIAITKEVFGAVQSVRELPNGYAFQLPNEKGLLIKTTKFIDNERLCCPFLSFNLEVESGDGPIWLQITGLDGVKPFIQAELGDALNETVAKAANFH